MDSTYMEVGTRVILRKHPDWSWLKRNYHGRRATITEVWTDFSGNPEGCLVDCDGGTYQWYPDDMILASDAKLLRSPL